MAEIGETDARSAEKLGYLGLGMMGFPMTRRLVSAGHDVTVWNRSPGKAAALVAAGAKAALHPSDVATTASILFMCLTDAAAVEEVVFGPDGLATATGSGKLVVDFSSIHPDAARAIAARLKAANGMGWIDAPVSGGTIGAEEGTLAVMAGGDAADIERARPYVLAMARRFTHMGPTGAGQTTKLCNQVIVGCAMAVLAEEPFDGVFCVTDLLALGFLDAARTKFGRRVPDDLSVIGFDDIPQAGWDAYRLTTFRQPVESLTGVVMDVLRRRREHGAPPHALTTVPVELVVRSTVRGLVAEELAC